MVREDETYETIPVEDAFVKAQELDPTIITNQMETNDGSGTIRGCTNNTDGVFGSSIVPFPLNSFLLFSQDYRTKIKTDNDDSKISRKEVAKAWKNISIYEKEKYITKAKRERNRYEKRCKEKNVIPYEHVYRSKKRRNEKKENNDKGKEGDAIDL